jgi:hypothetical protein
VSSLAVLRPAWPAPPGVGAAMSLRSGGVSSGPWASLNLGFAVGDDAPAVAENRARYAAALGARPVWLHQVHGAAVQRLGWADVGAALPSADAAWTTERGIACTVQVADCLPVLLAARDGHAVAAAHAGWRGLAGGVLEATLAALRVGADAPAGHLVAWLGPCIGPGHFEVGAEVLQAFGHRPGAADTACFVARPRADGAPRWLAHLQRLAVARLQRAGVREISVADECTVADASRFFSFRRDGVTGRLAASVWRR